MSQAEAEKRLKKIAVFERDERKRQQIWKLKEDEYFSHLIVGYDEKDTIRFVTAVAREDEKAKKMEYEDVGDLKTAAQAGDPKIKNFHYRWSLPATKDAPAAEVSVRGRDDNHLTTYSLKRVGSEAGGAATASPAKAKEKAAESKQ